MNERGVASITAILILMMLAYLIRGTIFTAQNYADMTRNFELENRLQLAAESAFEDELTHYFDKPLDEADAYFDKQRVDGNINYTKTVEKLPAGVDGVVVSVEKKLITFKGTPTLTIKILAVAKKNNYFAKDIHAYRSVCGFLHKEPIFDQNKPPNIIGYMYKFKGFLHSTI